MLAGDDVNSKPYVLTSQQIKTYTNPSFFQLLRKSHGFYFMPTDILSLHNLHTNDGRMKMSKKIMDRYQSVEIVWKKMNVN